MVFEPALFTDEMYQYIWDVTAHVYQNRDRLRPAPTR